MPRGSEAAPDLPLSIERHSESQFAADPANAKAPGIVIIVRDMMGKFPILVIIQI